MIKLLAKFFIKDNKNYTDQKVRSAYGYLCGILGIAINILLFGGKFMAGAISGSVAVTADAFNNLSDAGSSAISLIGFRLASQKPDPHHPFGHGRFEYIASLIISMVIILMGFELGKDSVGKIVAPVDVEYSALTFAILGISILAKFYMFLYNRSIGKKIDSSTLKATATDSISDTVSTFAVLVSAVLCEAFDIMIDGWVGLVVAGFIMFAGISSAKETIDSLLGTAPDEEFCKKVQDIVLSHDGMIGIHDMIVHNYGPGRVFISLHAEVPSDGNFVDIHDTIDNIEHDIMNETGCLATIHMDPVDVRDEETAKMRAKVAEIIKETDEKISFHDFRMVSGPTHTNVIFDIVVPHDYKLSDGEIAKLIADKIHAHDEKYFAVIDVDKDFTAHQQI
ncbi:MAG: cation transporter [Oscillospiraceae bacterium]|nr:cation transporter [Oscillospiraceae bacterium]MBQ2861369.1 cation transporter [Oscillospiraceae bacterium]MBQ2998738.1 cation transporter [Oscillospiraceae bacterium]MBQ3561040.1 cation transporter [Oscillospiraceae bacterium]